MAVSINSNGVKIDKNIIPKVFCPLCGQSGVVLTKAEAAAHEHFDVYEPESFVDPMKEDSIGIKISAVCMNCKVTLQMNVAPNKHLMSNRMLVDYGHVTL